MMIILAHADPTSATAAALADVRFAAALASRYVCSRRSVLHFLPN